MKWIALALLILLAASYRLAKYLAFRRKKKRRRNPIIYLHYKKL